MDKHRKLRDDKTMVGVYIFLLVVLSLLFFWVFSRFVVRNVPEARPDDVLTTHYESKGN